MSVQDNATKLGKPNQNLVLETAGRIYIKVQDRFYELKFKDLDERIANSSKNTTIINNQIASEPNLDDFVTKKYLKASLDEYVTKRSWNKIKETTSMLENSLLEGFTESINPITINTMQLVVGSEQLQYDFIPDYDDDSRVVPGGFVGNEALTRDHASLTGGWIKHYTLDGPNTVRSSGSWVENNATVDNEIELLTQYSRWYIEDGDFNLNEGSYYVYIKVPKLSGELSNYHSGYPEKDKETGNYYFNATEKFNSSTNTHLQATHSEAQALFVKTNALSIDDTAISSLSSAAGEFVVSQEAIELNQTEDGVEYYYLLYAIINSADGDGYREYSTMNGFTEITPGRVTAYRFMSPDGYQYLNFLDKTFHLGDAALEGEIPVDGPVTNTNSYIHWDEINGLIVKGNLKVKGGDLQDVLNMMQSQIDDEIQAWFSGDNPTSQESLSYDKHCEPLLNTWPANTWNHIDQETSELVYDYNDHLGDLYYITGDLQNYDPDDPQSTTYKGQCYRFIKTTATNNGQEVVTYSWSRVVDNALGKAYETIAGYDYLKAALLDNQTVVNGGLVLSSLIQLGTWTQNPEDQVTHINVKAGLSGIVQKENSNHELTYRDIAAWYGGDMRDKEDFYNWDDTTHSWVLKSGVTDPGTIAKTVFRHDGSGYLANGDIFWDSDGSLRVPGITLQQNESTHNWEIKLDSGALVGDTGMTLGEFNAFFEVDNEHTVGGKHPVKLKNAYAGLWAEGFGSFGGLNNSGSSGISLDTVWNSLTNNSDSYANRIINSAHIQLPVATSSTLGGIKTGYNSNLTSKQYGIRVDSNGNAYVYVPWEGGSGSGSSYTLPVATESDLGGVKVYHEVNSSIAETSVSGTARYFGLQVGSDGKAFVNVPEYTLPTLYIAQTQVSDSSTAGPLLGITGIINTDTWPNTPASSDNLSCLYWDNDNSAWHLRGNFIADGYGSFGGINSNSTTGISLDRVWTSIASNSEYTTYQVDDVHLNKASTSQFGIVKIGDGLAIDSITGKLYVTNSTGGIDPNQIGTGLVWDSTNNTLNLAVASSNTLGGIKIGTGLSIDNGVASVTYPFDNYFELVDNNANIRVKKIDSNTTRGFYNEGFICAGGIAPNQSDMLARIWGSLDKTYIDSCASVIDSSFLPIASSSSIGGVKIGSGLSIDSTTGELSVTSGNIGTVTGVQFDTSVSYATSTNYTPDVSGIIKLPPYPTFTETWTDYFGIDSNGDVYVKAKPNNGGSRGFYNEGFGSFGGLNSGNSNGITLGRVWQSLKNTLSDEYATDKIHSNHIPTALTNAIGGIKVSNVLNSAVTLTSGDGSTADRYYGVQIDSTGQAFVNVPWSGGSGGAYSGSTYININDNTNVISLNTTALTAYTTSVQNENYKVQIDSGSGGSGGLYVNVPHPNTYIGYTSVTKTQGNTTLLGIDGITNGSSTPTSSDLSWLYWDSNYNAWHLKGNFIADGYGTFGGVNSDAGSTTSLLNVWKSLTNDNTITNSDITSTIKISSSHLDLTGYQPLLGFTLTGTQSSYDLDNMGGGSTYTSGNGISIDASDSNKISVKLNYTTNSGSSVGKYKIENGTYLGNEGLYATIPVYNTRTLNNDITPTTGETTNDRYYGVEIDTASNKMFVNVPWTTPSIPKIDGISGTTINRYGICTVAAATQAKTVTITNGSISSLETGLKISVKFTNKNTKDSPTLNVNGLGAKSIFHNGSKISTANNKGMLSGVVDFVYDATLNSNSGGWHLVGNYVDTDSNNYHSGIYSSGLKIGTGVGIDDLYVPLGTSENSVCAGNDSRLSNSRTPTAHASSETTYGIGTQSNYGHVKLATGNMNGASHEDGVACSKNHTHSQYLTSFTETDPIFTASAASGITSSDITNWNNKTNLTIGNSSTTALAGDTKYAGSSSQGGAATSANKLNTNAGSATQPIYFSGGVPVATTYALNKTVPANAVFTDTWDVVTNSNPGIVPKTGTSAASTINTQSTEWVLTTTEGGTPSWRKLPTTAFSDNNTWTAATTSTAGYVPAAIQGKYLHCNNTTGNLEWVDDRYSENTDRYVNSAAFSDDSTSNSASPIKMTLTRAGSDSATVIANIPKVSNSSAGVVPKGTSVSSQTQNTKFLREDGTWATPSYTTNTNTTYKLSINGSTNGDNTNGVSLGTIFAPTTSIATDIYSILQSNGTSAPTWTNSPNLRGGLTVGYADTRTNQTSYTVEGNVTTKLYGTLTLYKNKALRSGTKYNFSAEDSVTLQTMPYQYYHGNGTSNSTNGYGSTYLGINSSVVLSSGKYYDSSDIRLKKNIKEITNTLTAIEDLPIVQYEYKSEEGRKYIGTLAQKLLPLYPELVIKGGDGYYSVDYGGLAAIAIQGLKELNKRVKYLEDKLYGNNER